MSRAVKQASIDWDGIGLADAPTAPETLKQAGLSLGFLNDLILRTLYTRGMLLGLDLARLLCLPFKIIEESLLFLKDEKTVEITGGDLIGRVSYRFNLTELGRKRAQEAQQTYECPAVSLRFGYPRHRFSLRAALELAELLVDE